MAKKNKADKEINKQVNETKANLEGESMSDIFNLKNNQTFSKEEKPKEKDGLKLWGQKH